MEEKAVVNLTAGKAAKVYVEYINTPAPPDSANEGKKDRSQPALMLGVVSGKQY